MTTGVVYRLQDFVRDAQQIVGRGLDEPKTMDLISEQLARVIAREGCLADFDGNDDPDPDRGFSVFRAENLAVIAVVWAANSGAPIHNHNGWAVEGVIRGKEFNRNYQRLEVTDLAFTDADAIGLIPIGIIWIRFRKGYHVISN